MENNIVKSVLDKLPAIGGFKDHNISIEELNDSVKKHITTIFSRGRMNDAKLLVYDISSSPDRNTNSPDFWSYFIEGRVRGYEINQRTISGRFKTIIKWDKKKNQLDSNETIYIYYGDMLSDNKRDSEVKDHIETHYEHPIDISIKNERLEIYPDNIYSYVSAIINKNRIIFLRVIFEKEIPIVADYQNKFINLVEIKWGIKRAETLFESTFPTNEQIKIDTKVNLFNKMSSVFHDSKKYEKLLPGGSSIKNIMERDLKEATNGKIKLSIKFEYILDFSGFFGSYKSYICEAFVFYQYDFEKRRWEFIDIEISGSPEEKK
jgi:hypothetical protein